MARTNGIATQGLIVETALDLFAYEGYAGTSMRDLADRVGIKPASLYNHFSSKEELLWHLCEWTMRTWHALLAHVEELGTTPLERFVVFVHNNTVFHARYRREALVINQQWRTLKGERLEVVTEYRTMSYRWLLALLEEGIADGQFRIEQPRTTALGILDMAIGLASWFNDEGPLTPEELGREYVALALRLAGRPQRKELPGGLRRLLDGGVLDMGPGAAAPVV